MNRVISLKDALELMSQVDRKGNMVPIESLEVYSWNKRGQNIGRLLRFRKCELVSIIRGKPVKASTGMRDINHWRNATRNIRELGTDNITTIHIWLITKINGLDVKLHIHG